MTLNAGFSPEVLGFPAVEPFNPKHDVQILNNLGTFASNVDNTSQPLIKFEAVRNAESLLQFFFVCAEFCNTRKIATLCISL